MGASLLALDKSIYYELNYTEVHHSSVNGLYCDKTELFFISWGDFKATWHTVVDNL